MTRIRITTFSIVILVLVVGIVPFVSAQDFGEIDSVCLVTDIGRLNDGGFNQFSNEGMERAAEEFDLETKAIETQAATDYENNINTCINEGFDAVVTVGFLITDATLQAALDNPDVYFIGVDQFHTGGPENLAANTYREDQSGFLAGVLAAKLTESGVIAGVYGMEVVPPVVRFRNGFEQGAWYINPDLEILGVYIDDFFAPDRGASAAEQFLGEGADVIFAAGGQTGNGALLTGADAEVWVIGVDTDQYFSVFDGGESPGAEFIATSAMKGMGEGVYRKITALIEGDLDAWGPGETELLSLAENGVSLAPKHDADIPDEIFEEVQEIADMLAAGDLETGLDFDSGLPLEDMEEESD